LPFAEIIHNTTIYESLKVTNVVRNLSRKAPELTTHLPQKFHNRQRQRMADYAKTLVRLNPNKSATLSSWIK